MTVDPLCKRRIGRGNETGVGVGWGRGPAMRAAAGAADALATLAGNNWLIAELARGCPERCPIPIPGKVRLMGKIIPVNQFEILPGFWIAVATRFWEAEFRCWPLKKGETLKIAKRKIKKHARR